MPIELRGPLGREQLTRLRGEAEHFGDLLPGLLVEAERVASTISQGVHGRRRTGVGESFWQYRPYQQGEPATAIDWRQSARSRHLFVREQEWEAAQSVWLWVDQSPSMRFRSLAAAPFKRDRAVILALALAALLVRGGERVAFLGAGSRPRGGRFGLARLADDLLAAADEAAGAPPAVPLPAYARLVLVSDWLLEPEELDRRLALLASNRVDAVLVQVIDPAEEELPFTGRVLFEGLEQEGDALIGNVVGIQERYRKLFQAHGETLGDLTRRRGWNLVRHRTDHSAESGLLPVFALMAPRAGQ